MFHHWSVDAAQFVVGMVQGMVPRPCSTTGQWCSTVCSMVVWCRACVPPLVSGCSTVCSGYGTRYGAAPVFHHWSVDAAQFIVGMVQSMVPLSTCAPGYVATSSKKTYGDMFKIILDNGMCLVFFS